jgi:CheY-like chemotaxis protein
LDFEQEPRTRSGKRLLLAEDDPPLRRLLQVILERAGYEVIQAVDGLEAMTIVLSKPIDVVITDAMMPNVSGAELCRLIKHNKKLSHLPVILLSALEDSRNASKADAFLSKPLSGEQLVRVIEELLAKK